MNKRVVIVGFYLPGIYPAGDDSVVSDLLAPALLKVVSDADPEISSQFDVEVLNLPTTLTPEAIAEKIDEHKPTIVAYSVYMWNYDQMVHSSQIIKKTTPNYIGRSSSFI